MFDEKFGRGNFGIKNLSKKKNVTVKIKNISTINKFFFGFVFVLFLALFSAYGFKFFEIKEVKTICNDGTPFNECSKIQPYFCLNGALVERALFCGCGGFLARNGNFCASSYQSEPKNITLKYVLKGQEFEINFTVYKGMADYLSNLSKVLSYHGDKSPLRKDFKLRNIDEPQQREFLLPLVKKIQDTTFDKEDQVRIAISAVQNIPFGESDKVVKFRGGNEVAYERYPYEVLYDVKGVCGEKSELLAFILRELGYEVAFFYHKEENHESLGIRCPLEHSLGETGYCFVETTGPSIITDESIEYVGGVKLESSPQVILISNGSSLGDDWHEYKDADSIEEINSLLENNGWVGPINYFKLKSLKQKYRLGEDYKL